MGPTGKAGVGTMRRTFARKLDALQQIFGFVAEFLAPIDPQSLDHREIQLVVEELFTNFLRHNRDGANEIGIELQRYSGHVEVIVTDTDVEPFDITQVPAMQLDQPLEKRRGGGMGLQLVRTIADKLSYEYSERTSRVIVEKKLELGNV